MDLLKDNSSSNRFFAIFNLIEKFPESLSNIEGVFVDNIYNLLFDDYAPIVDRVPWALSIIGDKALDKLIEKYYSVTMDVKPLIIHAIGRGNFSKRFKDRVKVLLEALLNQTIRV
ncbi:hypothetical protein [Tenacibaculum sp. nBUS_03]|uniref:hypothetical protein n=1 Tax=Tenacibaculum sp. nBUS_03 TaxID=3395320 RepID=UPI003EBAED98